MTKYEYREEKEASKLLVLIKNLANVLLINFMDWIATSKDSHWWDWREIKAKEVDKSVKQLFIKTNFVQKRKYRSIPVFGRFNLGGIRDLYITLRVLEETAVICPVNYNGKWSLVIRGKYGREKYMLSRFLQRGKVKCLLDGKKHFLGLTDSGRYIPVKLVEICNRRKHKSMLFV